MNRGEPPAEQVPETKPLVPRDLDVVVAWEHPLSGELHRATVVSRIMTRDELVKRDRWAAACAGMPWEHLPPAAQSQIWALVSVATQLREVPDWLLEAIGEDEELLGRLFAITEAHTARYFRRDGGAGQEGAGGRRLEVVAHGLAGAAA
jgi:hypothetical protein